MRILFVSPRYSNEVIGGGEISLQILTKALAERGHQIKVLTTEIGKNKEILEGVEIERLPKIKYHISLFILKILKESKKFDVIHGYNSELISQLILSKIFIRKPLIITLNYFPSKHFPKFLAKYGGVNMFHCVSNSINEAYQKIGIDKEKLLIIENMLEKSFLQNQRSRTKNVQRITYIGQLKRQKGIHLLLEAFSKLKNQNLKLIIVGKGPEKNNLIQLSKSLGISSRVSFTELDYSKIKNHLDSCDILIQPSLWPEASSRVIIEAMSRGCVPIVSGVGANRELVCDEGLIFEKGKINELIKKLKSLIYNKEIFIKNSREAIGKSKRFSNDNNISKFEKLYVKSLDDNY